jgi:hypothetical protein
LRPNATIVLAGVCLLSLITPSPARAALGGGWLERLSGPGPFTGLGIDVRLLCLGGAGASRNPVQSQALESFDAHPWGRKLTHPLTRDGKIWVTGAGCYFLESDQPRLEVGLDLEVLHSGNNVLDYSHLPGVTASDTKVNLRTFMVSADIRVNRVLDVGAAIGRGWFSAPSDLFPGFSKMVTQPMRLTTRPLAVLSHDKRWEAVVVRFDGTRFRGAFTAQDFGARPGSYNEPGEIIWTWSIRVDPLALLW